MIFVLCIISSIITRLFVIKQQSIHTHGYGTAGIEHADTHRGLLLRSWYMSYDQMLLRLINQTNQFE